jgi:hypothetical protein
MEKISYTGQEEADFYEEDPRSEEIKKMTDPDEIKKAQSELENKYDEPSKEDTSSTVKEPSEDKKEDTSKAEADKTEPKEKESKKEPEAKTEGDEDDSEKAEPEGKIDEFKITDEFIKTQPEGNREILSKYAGKDKSEIAKAAANAIAMKNDLMKGKQKLINAYAEELAELPEAELLEQLVQSQRETGVNEYEAPELDEDVEIVMPALPKDDPKVSAIINTEVVKRMKKLYPDMPDDMKSPEYLEWERELHDEKGQDGVDDLQSAKRSVRSEVTDQLQTVVYAQENLKNLYFDSPNEILDYISEDNLPKLKHINDNYIKINNATAIKEVEAIKNELKTLNLTPEDLGLDLTLRPDASGGLTNPTLDKYLYVGENVDESVVGMFGKVPILKPGALADKFIKRNNTLILTHMNSSRVAKDQTEREKIKAETLTSVSSSSSGQKVVPEKDLTKVTNPAELSKIMADIESKYD